MGYTARATGVVMALLGALTFSQAPEFSQQYRQRLGGALDELRVIISDFDDEARRYNLDRDQALALYDSSREDFIRARGSSMRSTFARYRRLSDQLSRLSGTPPLWRPIVVFSEPDAMIVKNAWKDFAPAVPVTVSGFAWGAAGALSLSAIAGLITLPGRRHKRATLKKAA
ncbi:MULTISPECIES: DUF2937 family protein [unclassified Sinorhizobium]|uniref:DUF2937 family protein n=1 Tax=unclassified Sinorhizobium TaxID=2613772 RepID=UPI003524CF43